MTATVAKTKTPIIPDPLPITVETGIKVTQTTSNCGDASKPVSVYGDLDLQNPLKSSSGGINFNIADFTLTLRLGFDDSGISGSLANGNTTNSFGLKLNLSEFKIGFEHSAAIQWDNKTETTYTNFSVSGWAIAAMYIYANTGQLPAYAYK